MKPVPFGRLRHPGMLLAASLATVMFVGCGEHEIRRYQVPKPERLQLTTLSSDESPQRLLAAIIPHGDRTWFFKLLGPADRVGQHEKSFEQFIRSIRFDLADGAIAWTLPDGWHEHPGSSALRYATFHVGSDEGQPLELTVIPLGQEAGSVLDNVNRWRGQIGLPPVGEAQLDEFTTPIELDGAAATLVDFTGTRGPSSSPIAPLASGRLPQAPAGPSDERPRPALTYEIPTGWKEQPLDPQGMRAAAFDVMDDNQQAEVTVIPLPGPAGGLVENINRWRGQVGLDTLSEDELRNQIQQIDVAGQPAHYVDIVGRESLGGQRGRILAVILSRGEITWFFKMTGPADLVEKQKPSFEEWVQSVRLTSADESRG